MKKSNVIQFGVQLQYVCKYEEENARPTIMVVSPDGRVLDVVSNFVALADVLERLCRDIEDKSVVNTDN